MPNYEISFLPIDKTVAVAPDTSLLDAAAQADITIDNICGGDGICGRCKMIVKQGKVNGDVTMLLTREEIRQGYVLGCQSFPASDLVVEIPEATRARARVAIDKDAERFRAADANIASPEFPRNPLVTKLFCKLSPPTLDDNLADCQRLQGMIQKELGLTSMQAGLKIIRGVADLLRENDFGVTVTIGRRRDILEIMEIEGGDTSNRNFMAVVDIGTTTIVVHLVNILTRETMDAEACFNSQSIYGREVTARIIATEKRGADALQKLLAEDINKLVSAVALRQDVRLHDITAVVCAGNSTMMHFLLGLPTRNIRREPFIAATLEPPPIRAAEIDIKINPRGLVFSIPGIGSWVGADITAGILATGLHEMDEIGMLVDVGTNGEVVVGNKDWLVSCSASVGPALEGASVDCGMLAGKGAIEAMRIDDNGQIRYTVIGGGTPVGICGSGIIDLIAVLLDKGIIDRAGRFVEDSDPDIVFENDRGKFRFAGGLDAPAGEALWITQDDVDNVITAKAAVFAAIKIILDRLQLGFDDIGKLFLAGGFGKYINRENAVKIGLLPDLSISRIQYAGNASIQGAKLAALSDEAYQTMYRIRRGTTYYDLLGSPDYVEQFTQAMFLPHTDLALFPSVMEPASRNI